MFLGQAKHINRHHIFNNQQSFYGDISQWFCITGFKMLALFSLSPSSFSSIHKRTSALLYRRVFVWQFALLQQNLNFKLQTNRAHMTDSLKM